MTLSEIYEVFPHAIACGCIIAVTCAVFGVLVVLNRIVFISVALSETAACGIAVAMLCQVNPYYGAGTLCLFTVVPLSFDWRSTRLTKDALLGVVFAGAAALSVVLVSKSGFGLNEVKALLYGDLILSSATDLKIILAAHVPAVGLLILCMRPMLYTFFDREHAQVMKVRTRFWKLSFYLLLGLVVSAASKIAGALLVFSFLVVCPAAALLLVRRWHLLLVTAPAIALVATLVGIKVSVSYDLPTNPTIMVVACVLFLLTVAVIIFMTAFRMVSASRRAGNGESYGKSMDLPADSPQ